MIHRRKLLTGSAALAAYATLPEQVDAFWQSRDSNYNKNISGGSAAPTWTPTGNPAAQNTNTSSATFSGVAIGSPAASDVIVAIASAESQPTSPTMTCNGVSMTLRAEESTVISDLQIFSITASSAGVTGSATTTFVLSSTGNFGDQIIQIGKLTGVSSAPSNTGSSTSSSIGVTVPATGFAIVGGFGSAVSSWSGGIQDFDTTSVFSEHLYMVHATTTGTVSESGAGSFHLVYASWGP